MARRGELAMDKYTSRIMAWQLRNPLWSDFSLDDLDGPLASASLRPQSLQELCLRRVALACDELATELPPLLQELLLDHACREGLLSPALLSACLTDRLELTDFGSRDFSVSAAVRHVASMASPPVLLQTVLLSWCYGFEASALLMLLAAVGGQLRVLHLWKCGYVDDGCARAVASRCPLLEDVDLRGCKQLTAASRAELLRSCTRLERVRLGEMHNDASVTAAGKLLRLRVLELPQSDEITCTGASHLRNCSELVHLNLTRSSVGRRSLAAIAAGCPLLSALTLDRCHHVDDRALAELRLLTGLRDLSVASTAISERSLVELPRLRRLKVNGCRCTALPAKRVPTEVLEMSGCPELRDVAFSHANALRVLDLSATPLRPECVAHLPLACANMRCLVLKEVEWLLPEILDAVVGQCYGSLQHLDLDQSEPIQGWEDQGSAVASLSRCTQLETLTVTGHGVGSHAIGQVLRNCPKLSSINACCPDLISEGQFAALDSSPCAAGLRALRERFTQFSFRTISSDGVGILIHRERPNDSEPDGAAAPHLEETGPEEAIRRSVFLAQTAEAAERYDEMCVFMREVCMAVPELNAEGRNLLYLAFKKRVGALRTHWRVVDDAAEAARESGAGDEAAFASERLESLANKIAVVAGEVFAIIDRLESLVSTDEAGIFYMKMRADYHRYLAETRQGMARTAAAQVADAGYAEALARARGALRSGHATLLGVALNYAIFMREVCADRDGACRLVRATLAGAALEYGSYPDGEEAAAALQLLRDNLGIWTTELTEGLESGGLIVEEADEP